MSTCANVKSRSVFVAMMNCPKCQFEQPIDQFCASCGIDMERYARAHRPKSTRRTGPALWGGLLVLALIVALFVLTPLFSTPIFFGDSQDLSLQEERIESFGRFNIGDPNRAVTSEPRALGTAQQNPAQQAPATAPEETTALPTQEQPLKLTFALVPVDVVAKWIQLAKDFSANENISSGVLGPISLQDSARDIEALMTYSSKDLEEGLAFLINIEEVPDLEAVGFSLEGEWEQGILSLEAVLVTPEEQQNSAGPVWGERESVQRWSFELNDLSSAFIVGLMPRPLPLQRTTPWDLPGLFDLWDSEDFVLGQKELVLIIAPGR